jgi:Mn2+/Fe2+ NRAMP family transporter
MLPFDNRPWAKRLAAVVIVCTVVCEITLYLWIRTEGPLNFSENLAFVMFFLAVIPPNVQIIRSKKPIVEGKPRMPHGAIPVHK